MHLFHTSEKVPVANGRATDVLTTKETYKAIRMFEKVLSNCTNITINKNNLR